MLTIQRHFKFTLFLMIVFLSFTVLSQTDPDLDKQRENCAKNKAMEWSSTLNRCVGKQSAINERNESKECDHLESIEAKKSCYMKIAEGKTGIDPTGEKETSKISSNQTRSMIVNGANSIVSLINMTAESGKSSSCMSKQIMGYTAYAGIASDVYLKMTTKKKTENLLKKYQLEKSDNAYTSQVKAYEYLKEEQKTIKEVAGLEKKRQMLLMLGYGAAGAMALYEQFSPSGSSCTKNESKANETKTSESTTPPQESTTSTSTTTDSKSSGIGSQISGMLSSPAGIAILSGIGAVNAYTLYSAASEQEKECDQNIKKINAILTTFKDSWVNHCPNGHEKLEDPKCYCYTEQGKKNTNRTNSEICKALWAKGDFRISGEEDSYLADGKPVNPAGCLTKSGQFDENCKCKHFTDTKGENACMKGMSINLGGTGIGTDVLKATGVDQLSNAVGNLANGNGLAGINISNAQGAIKRQNQFKNALGNKLKNNKNAQIALNKDELQKAQNAIFPSNKLANYQRGSSSPHSILNDARENSPFKNEIMNAAGKAGIDLVGSGKGGSFGNKKNEKENFFNFGQANNNQNGNVLNYQDPMDKNYNYKNNDISKNDGPSIFEIITNRYMQSGLKRLFDDGTKKEKSVEESNENIPLNDVPEPSFK